MGYSSADPRNYFALAKQTAVDVEASTGFKFVRYLGNTGFDVQLDTQTIYEGGGGQDPNLSYRQHTKADGSLDAYARPDMFTYLSAWSLGSAAAVGTSVGVGTSIYTPNATMPFLTAEQAWGGGNQIDRTSNVLLTGFQVQSQAGDPWTITVPFVSGGTPYYRDGAASALTAVLETGDPAMHAGGAYIINGASTIDLRSFNYNFQRKVDDNLYTNTTFRRKVVPLTRTVSVDMQIIWQDQAYYKQVLYGGGSIVPANLATGAFHAERQLTASQLIAIDVPLLNLTDVTVNRLMPDGETVVLDIHGEGLKGGTGLVQHTSVHNAVTASSYL